MRRAKYLRFECVENLPIKLKTEIWQVHSNSSNVILGMIRWYSPWRQYVFEPSDGTIFNIDCMNEISQQVASLTKQHRALLQEKRRSGEADSKT